MHLDGTSRQRVLPGTLQSDFFDSHKWRGLVGVGGVLTAIVTVGGWMGGEGVANLAD
jgi:hypothetical protein